MTIKPNQDQPLEKLDHWEDFVSDRVYPEPGTKAKDDYRNYDEDTRDGVVTH